MTPLDAQTYFAADAAYTRFNSVRSLRLDEPALEIRRFGEWWAARDARRPGAYYNRVFGAEPDAPGLDSAIAWVREVREQARIDSLARPNQAADELVLLGPTQIPTANSEFEIRMAGPNDLEAVFDLWEHGETPISRAARDARRDVQIDPDFPIHIAHTKGATIAMASTFYSNGIAWLGNANTLPEFRRRGAHRSLLEARMHLAARRAAAWVITDVSPESGSHESALKSGFRPIFGITYSWDESK